MFLDISKDGSDFYSYPKYVYDSLKNVQIKKSVSLNLKEYDFSHLRDKSKIQFSIRKVYPSYNIYQLDQIGEKYYTIEKTNEISWQILPDKKNILGFMAQKAVARFGERNWIAWFTEEIPFQDGPYCFHGLPGLILSIEDTVGDHVFNIIGIKAKTETSYSKAENNKIRHLYTSMYQIFNKKLSFR